MFFKKISIIIFYNVIEYENFFKKKKSYKVWYYFINN